MKSIEELKSEFENISKLSSINQIEPTFAFNKELLSSDDLTYINFHYSLLNNRSSYKLYQRIRASFSKRSKEIIEPFLLNKLHTETNDNLRADVIQLLGNIRSEKILPYAVQNIQSEIRDIRYRCIIVIGWVGGKVDLPVLNERLMNEPDDELRGYAATAMRQIWFKKKASSEDILPYLYTAVQKEEKEITLQMIIIVIQDLTKTKFGLQERINDAIITGDAFKAKAKILKKLLAK